VRISGSELKISPLKAVTPAEAEALAHRLYAMMPNLRITSLLAEVDRWSGFSSAFTHLHSGTPAEDRRVVLTAVLADATNLGLTRMAEACSLASYRQLAWTAAWQPARGNLSPSARDPGECPAAPATCRSVRRRRCIQFGWPAFYRSALWHYTIALQISSKLDNNSHIFTIRCVGLDVVSHGSVPLSGEVA
jgi:Tn3 transposase DDE domain